MIKRIKLFLAWIKSLFKKKRDPIIYEKDLQLDIPFKVEQFKCEVCGEMRNFLDLGTQVFDASYLYNLRPGTMQRNVNYCKNKNLCIEGSFKKIQKFIDYQPSLDLSQMLERIIAYERDRLGIPSQTGKISTATN